jgi:preprotein translocase subunit YajC
MRIFNFFLTLAQATPEPFLSGGTTTEDVASSAATAAATAAPAAGGGGLLGGGIFPTVLIYAVIIGAAYFLMIRPQRKRDKEFKSMQSGLKTGDSVLTAGGLFGTIVSIGEDCFILEFGTNKSVRVPVRKTEVVGVASPKTSLPSTGE